MGRCFFKFSAPPEDVYVLISGSHAFFNEKSLKIRNNKAVLIIDSHYTYLQKPPPYIPPFQRIKNMSVGRCSSFRLFIHIHIKICRFL